MSITDDYIRRAANNLGLPLNSEQVREITEKLVQSENFIKMVQELEDMIFEANKIKWRRK